MTEITPTESEFNKLGHEVYEHEPEVVQKFLYVLKRPTPTFTHYQYIALVQKNFCDLKNISFWQFRKGVKIPNLIQHRIDFIYAIVYLFNPEILTGYSDVITSGLAEELCEAMNGDRTWVSQQVKNIKRIMNEKKYHGNIEKELREKIKATAEKIAEGLKEEPEEPGAVVSLFKDQTG